jgi:hypothetical protein
MNDLNSQAEWSLNTFSRVNEDKLPGFGRLLESWQNVHRKYCNGCRPDNSWDYQERSQIGFLSNAAVLIGGIALEEWGTQKKSRQGESYYGRSDLWLCLCPPLNWNGDAYHIESKHCSLDLRQPVNDSYQIINNTMALAFEDAKVLRPTDGGRSMAISFFTLWFPDKKTDALDNKISKLLSFIEMQSQESSIHAIAAIWIDAKDFDLCRRERYERSSGKWDAEQVGLILLAKHNDCT